MKRFKLDQELVDRDFNLQKDINKMLSVTLEKDIDGNLIVTLYDTDEEITDYKFSTLEEVKDYWGRRWMVYRRGF